MTEELNISPVAEDAVEALALALDDVANAPFDKRFAISLIDEIKKRGYTLRRETMTEAESDDADKALARAARNIGWLEALPPYGDKDTRKAAADDMCRALEELRAHIAALEAENKRLREALQFYADGPYVDVYRLGVRQDAVIFKDAGARAKQALAQTDEPAKS